MGKASVTFWDDKCQINKEGDISEKNKNHLSTYFFLIRINWLC